VKIYGISYSKNIGLKNCTGEYFFFAGADDIQNCERISKPLDYLLKNPSTDIVYFDCTICSSSKVSKSKENFHAE
jgi:glycosyltransferase involved in cell wall biosynthesis